MGEKRKKGTALCRITAVFYRGNMEGVGRGETFRGFDSGCGIEYNGKSCARPRRPPERGGGAETDRALFPKVSPASGGCLHELGKNDCYGPGGGEQMEPLAAAAGPVPVFCWGHLL